MRFRINEEIHELDVDPRTSLLDLLREHLHLSGTKKGCDQGACGACTILVDGERINSCLALAVQYEGSSITTIEGIGSSKELGQLQAAFIECDGFQCGYCTPGQICSAVGMAAEARRGVPSPDAAAPSTLPDHAGRSNPLERASYRPCACRNA